MRNKMNIFSLEIFIQRKFQKRIGGKGENKTPLKSHMLMFDCYNWPKGKKKIKKPVILLQLTTIIRTFEQKNNNNPYLAVENIIIMEKKRDHVTMLQLTTTIYSWL